MAKEYRVTLNQNFVNTTTAPRHIREGIAVTVAEGYTGPLTKDQLKALEDDQYVTVKYLRGEDEPDEESSDDGNQGDSEEDLKELSRVELNDRAKAAGVEKPENLQNKAEVIDAMQKAQKDS